MLQIRNIWAGLDKRRQIMVIAAAVGVVVSLTAIARLAATPSMKLLYAGLESGAAGEVVSSLEQRGIPFEVRGGAIYVPAADRDELRMTLAGQGLPANGGRGYELLDSLNGFGTTSQMFNAAYWRAKEGELARTIVASPRIAQARVHIASSGGNPFQRGVEPTASVSVAPGNGKVSSEQADAIRYLVASAVPGLRVEKVAVIDANGTLVGPADADAGNSADDRAERMRQRVLRLLEARVGLGNAVVELSLDMVTETESIRARKIDPAARVAISTEVEESSDASRNLSDSVTVASNLPDGDGAGGDESNSTASTSRERINYEISETETEILRVPGAVRRLTIAVLVDGQADSATGAFQPRSDAELESLRELVESATGFDAGRGDVITIKSMDLPVVEERGAAAKASFWQSMQIDVMSLVQLTTLALVSLVLGLFVIRPVLAKPPLPVDRAPAPLAAPEQKSGAATKVLTGEIQEPGDAAASPLAGGAVPLPVQTGTESSNEPVDRLRAMIGNRQEETVEILRSWLEEREERV